MNEDAARHRALAREAIAQAAPFPEGRFAGRGVVMCGGGRKYFPPAWVGIRMLRHVGCTLPIELWHLGPLEMSDAMRALVAPYGVTCVDGLRVREDNPVRRLNGWELKPFAILHSRFEEVLFLDADNVPVVDPTFLLDCAEYRRCGAVFWPDFSPIERKSDIWEAAEVEYRYEPSFESGQIVVDKRRMWNELQLTMHYNEYSDFYYRYTGGDKDTFHLAWRRLDSPYALIPHHVHAMSNRVMNQHDFDGRVIFHHRNNAKWTLDLAANPRIAGFHDEERCLDYLKELAARWPGDPARCAPDSPDARRAWDAVVATERFLYHRIGHDRRILRLCADQAIEGAGALEVSWHVRTREQVELCICAARSVTCALTERPDGVWVGRWEQYERMPIELVPIAQVAPEEQLALERDAREAALTGMRSMLVRVRCDWQVVRCEPGGRLITDTGEATGWRWAVRCQHGELALELVEPGGGERLLREDPDGIFREPRPGSRDRLEFIVLPPPPPW